MKLVSMTGFPFFCLKMKFFIKREGAGVSLDRDDALGNGTESNRSSDGLNFLLKNFPIRKEMKEILAFFIFSFL